MPKKIRELKALLSRAGFAGRPGKGSHVVWTHPRYPGMITIAGKDGSDAPAYMERQVGRAVAAVREAE